MLFFEVRWRLSQKRLVRGLHQRGARRRHHRPQELHWQTSSIPERPALTAPTQRRFPPCCRLTCAHRIYQCPYTRVHLAHIPTSHQSAPQTCLTTMTSCKILARRSRYQSQSATVKANRPGTTSSMKTTTTNKTVMSTLKTSTTMQSS